MTRTLVSLVALTVLASCPILAAGEDNAPSSPVSASFSGGLKKQDILDVSRKVADWQMANFKTTKPADWLNGTLYLGMHDWAHLSGDAKYDKWLRGIFNKQYWQPHGRMYHADDVCVCQTYIDMYDKHRNPDMLNPTVARIDWVIAHPSKDESVLNYSKPASLERWSWCDALFMAPPVYSRLYTLTGDKKYMEFAHKEFKYTYDKLFDKQEHLFYRDGNYIGKKEANGEKVFWGRGNGWVLAGLAEIMKTLPQNDKNYKPYYEKLLKEMAPRIAELQQPDGSWHASLLDPDSYPEPESSGTALLTYGLAYGINSGLLPREKYLPIVKKGWACIVNNVFPDGKLGYVQPVGKDPKKVSRDETEVYGVGAFLLAAGELHKLAD